MLLLFTGELVGEPGVVDPAEFPGLEPSGGWFSRTVSLGAAGEVCFEVGPGRHRVLFRRGGRLRSIEAVGPIDAVGEVGEPPSVSFLAPEYRWEHDGVELRFKTEWRETPTSVQQSRRHLVTLSANPHSLVVDADGTPGMSGGGEVLTEPVSAVVIDEVSVEADPMVVRWRSWHLDGAPGAAAERILVTHSRATISD